MQVSLDEARQFNTPFFPKSTALGGKRNDSPPNGNEESSRITPIFKKAVALVLAGGALTGTWSVLGAPATIVAALVILSVGYITLRTKTPVTRESVIESAKKEILGRIQLQDSNFEGAKSAKIFLNVRHGVGYLTEELLFEKITKERVIKELDILVKSRSKKIFFKSDIPMEVKVGILTQGEIDPANPIFLYYLVAGITVHKGETSNPQYVSFNNLEASGENQNNFCAEMGMPKTRQIDTNGKFI